MNRVILIIQENLVTKERDAVLRVEEARADIETQLREYYNKIQLEFERKMLEDVNKSRLAQSEKLMAERIEFETEIRTYYEQIILESERNLRDEYSKLFVEHEKKISEQRRRAEEEQRKLFQDLLSQRIEVDSTQDENRVKFVQQVQEQYEKLLRDQKAKIDEFVKVNTVSNNMLMSRMRNRKDLWNGPQMRLVNKHNLCLNLKFKQNMKEI
jgi:hypothetical protein